MYSFSFFFFTIITNLASACNKKESEHTKVSKATFVYLINKGNKGYGDMEGVSGVRHLWMSVSAVKCVNLDQTLEV